MYVNIYVGTFTSICIFLTYKLYVSFFLHAEIKIHFSSVFCYCFIVTVTALEKLSKRLKKKAKKKNLFEYFYFFLFFLFSYCYTLIIHSDKRKDSMTIENRLTGRH